MRPGDYTLRIEERDLGLSLMVDRPLPLAVRVTGSQQEPVSIRLVRAGAASGSVLIEAGPHPDRGVAPATLETRWEGKEGIAIHMQHRLWPEVRAVAISGSDGSFAVSRMLPGPWKIWVHYSDLPKERELTTYIEPVVVHIHQGATESLAPIRIGWRRRSRQFITGAPLSLEGAR